MNVTFVKRGTVINISRPKRFAEKVGLFEKCKINLKKNDGDIFTWGQGSHWLVLNTNLFTADIVGHLDD